MLEFPLWSVAVTVTVLIPEFAQLNDKGVAIKETTEQLSVGVAAVGPASEIVPPLFKYIVGFWQIKFGRVVSTTETVALQLEEFELISVTVRVTKFGPRFTQLKLELDKTNELIVQLFEDPLFICAAVIVAAPEPLSRTVAF